MFETYETEYDLVHRPVFTWDSEHESQEIGPGQKKVITVNCFGKVGWYVNHHPFSALIEPLLQYEWCNSCIVCLCPAAAGDPRRTPRGLPHPTIVISRVGHGLPHARVPRHGYSVIFRGHYILASKRY